MDHCFENTGCRIDASKSYLGNLLVILENRLIRLSLMPEYGAKIYEFTYKPLNYNFIWENSRIKGRKSYYGANYDNFSTGGMEDAFPTGLPSNINGEEIPFFGEVWAVPWQHIIEYNNSENISVRFECYCAIYPVKIEKTVTLLRDELSVTIVYRIINLSNLEVDYIWGIYPSISINSNCRIKVPDTFYNINVCQLGDSSGIGRTERFKWPFLDRIDLSRVMDADSRVVVNIYSDPLAEGWLYVFDDSASIGFV